MTKPNLISQIYGYAVCLVAVITFLISTSSLITNLIDKQDPLSANRYGWYATTPPSLASFENYKMDVLKTKGEGNNAIASYMPDDKTLHEMYEAAKSEKINSELHYINKSIAVESILIILCVLLFVIHWRWVRKLRMVE